jgi:mono/diheme cytochrome c family protein
MKQVWTVAAMAAVLVLAGCRQDMHDQPKFTPQRGTSFYADGRSARPQVENTVARNQLHQDEYFYTGLQNGKEGDGLPLALTPAVMERGQERYNIYCTPCHSRVGNGVGMIVQRGYRPAGNFHEDRLRNAPLGHFFSVITNGYGAMPEYASQITPEDRWAIAAYIRALQLSQDAKQSDIASGGHVEDLHAIAKDAGMPSGFADPWSLPQTAIYGTPNNQDNGIPGQPIGAASPAASAHYGQAAMQKPAGGTQ